MEVLKVFISVVDAFCTRGSSITDTTIMSETKLI
jgi:hypothetical protein